MRVSGNGQAYLAPDIAYIYVGVHTEKTTAADAVAENTTQTQTVIDAIKNFGIDPKDIRTTNFSIYPQDKYDPQTGAATLVNGTATVTVALQDAGVTVNVAEPLTPSLVAVMEALPAATARTIMARVPTCADSSSEASTSQIACRFSPSPVEEANTAARSFAQRPASAVAARRPRREAPARRRAARATARESGYAH